MNKRSFIILLAITAVVAVLVALWPGRSPDQSVTSLNQKLLPAMQQKANDLDQVQIVAAGGEVVATLQRLEDRWVLREASQYPADWERLRPLLRQLAEATVAEPKTSSEDYYDRLGVEDINSPEASGVLLKFPGDAEVPDVIIGKRAQGREGQYARVADQQQSVLLDRSIDVPLDRKEWLAREIVDIPQDQVVEVEISHADGEVVKIRRGSTDDTDFTLESLPEGREVKSNWTVNSLAGALAALELDDVAPVDHFAERSQATEAIEYRLVTVSGLAVNARWFRLENDAGDSEYWIRLSAEGFGTEATEETLERVAEINRRAQGWAYRLPQYKYAAATKRLDELLAEKESS